MKSQIFSIIFNLETVLAPPWTLFIFFFIIFLLCELYELEHCHPWTSTLDLQSTRQSTGQKFFSRMSVNFPFYWSQSSNTIIANTSSDHRTYSTFRAWTNETQIAFLSSFRQIQTRLFVSSTSWLSSKNMFLPVLVYRLPFSLFTPLDSLVQFDSFQTTSLFFR